MSLLQYESLTAADQTPAFAVKHSLRFTKTQFSAHMEERTTVSYSLFVRRATTCIIMTLISVITTLFSLFLVPTLLPWTSWEHTHQGMARAVILTVPDEINNTRLTWWTIFAMSVAYVLLSFALGEETRDSAKWIHKMWLRRNELFKWTRSLKYVVFKLPSFTLTHFSSSSQASPTCPSSPYSSSATTSQSRALATAYGRPQVRLGRYGRFQTSEVDLVFEEVESIRHNLPSFQPNLQQKSQCRLFQG